jgi:prevent-host-death family protein
MKTVTTREAQHHLSKVIEMVEAGEEVVITRRGRKLVKLSLYQEDRGPVEMPDFEQVRRRLGTEGAGGENAVLAEREGSM